MAPQPDDRLRRRRLPRIFGGGGAEQGPALGTAQRRRSDPFGRRALVEQRAEQVEIDTEMTARRRRWVPPDELGRREQRIASADAGHARRRRWVQRTPDIRSDSDIGDAPARLGVVHEAVGGLDIPVRVPGSVHLLNAGDDVTIETHPLTPGGPIAALRQSVEAGHGAVEHHEGHLHGESASAPRLELDFVAAAVEQRHDVWAAGEPVQQRQLPPEVLAAVRRPAFEAEYLHGHLATGSGLHSVKDACLAAEADQSSDRVLARLAGEHAPDVEPRLVSVHATPACATSPRASS